MLLWLLAVHQTITVTITVNSKKIWEREGKPGTKYQSCPVKWNVWEDSTEKLTNTHTETKSCEPDAGTGDKEITNTTKQKIKNYK